MSDRIAQMDIGINFAIDNPALKRLLDSMNELDSKAKSLNDIFAKMSMPNLTKASQDMKSYQSDLSKTKDKVTGLEDSMKHFDTSTFDKIKNKLGGVNDASQKTHSAFKSVFSANLLSNAVTSGFSYIKNSFGSLIKSAHQYNLDQQTMSATWLTLTGNASKGKAMVKQVDDLAAAAQNSTKMVDDLSQKFYAINKNPEATGKLTKSVLTLQDAFGKSDDEVENFGTQFGQMMANGKVSAQDMMSFVNTFPVLRTNLLKTMQLQTHNHSLTMQQMNGLMSKGQISSKTMIGVVESTAHSYKNATDNFNKTIPGMVRTVKSQMPRLLSAFDKPFTKLENPIVKQVSDWATSKKTNKAFTRLGKTTSTGLDRVMKSFGIGHSKTSMTSVLDKGIDKLGSGLNKTFDWVANHGKDIKTFDKSLFSITTTIGKGVWHDFSTIFVDIGKAFGLIGQDADKHGGSLHALAEGLDNLAKNKTALQVVSASIVAIMTAKATKQAALPFLEISKHGLNAVKYTSSFAKGLRGITEVKGLDKVSTKFLNTGSKIRDVGKTLGSKFKAGFSGSSKIGSSIVETLKGWKTKLFDTGSKWGKSLSDGFRKTIDLGKDLSSKTKVFGEGLFGKGAGAGKLNGVLQSAHSAEGGFKGLTTAGKIGTGLAGAGVALDAGASFFQAFKDRNNADKRSEDIGKGIGSGIGGGIGLWFGGPLGAAIGTKIGGIVGKWGGQAVNKFTKGWQANKPPKNFWSLENLGWSTHDMITKVGKAAGRAQQSLQRGWKSKKPPKKFWSLENLGWVSHKIWDASIIGTVTHGMSSLKKGWTSKKPPKNFWSLENLGWSTKNMFGGFIKGVEDVLDWFHKKWDGMTSWIGKTKDGVQGWFSDIGKGVQDAFKPSKSTRLAAHAAGGHISKNSLALVGEGGAELAYRANGGFARLLGANGPEIAKVHSGEHILNARDTQKVMQGGLGQGLVLKGYAKGNTSLGSTGGVSDKYQRDELSKNKRFNKSIVSDSRRSFASRVKANKKQFNQLEGDTGSSFKKLKKQWSKSWTDITHDFRKILNRLTDYSADAMSGVIGQINHGFKGINTALGQFGGNDHVLNMVHYANGTDRPVERPHLAVLNDSPRGLRQEAIVHANGSFELPKGNNVVRALRQGDSVLNGEDTYKAQRQGLLPFYANGKNSHGALIKLAEKKAENYRGGFNSDFTNNVKVKKTRLQQGLTTMNKNAAKPTGYKWYQAMYNYINSLISDGAGGTREAFLNYAKEHFTGKKYVMGATGPDAYDCSGMVAAALDHFGLNIGRTTVAMQGSSGVQSLGHDFAKTVPGDLVIYGHGGGAAGHVGIINNKANNTMFNEAPPSARVTSIDTPKSMGYEYFRVKGLHNANSHKSSISGNLTRLVKQQLGSRAINWIKHNLSEDALGGSINLSGDIGQRARSLAKALMGLDHSATKNGIAAVLGNWFFESRLDTSARNASGGASGLGQWLGGRLDNLKSYAKKHGRCWTDPAVQLKFALSGEGSDSAIFKSVLEGRGSVTNLANKFSSEWERGGYNASHVNGALQIAKSLRGLRKGGHVKAGETVRVNEDGVEMFRPDVSGTVIPHAKTVKNIKNNSKKAGNVTLNQTIEVHAEGSNAAQLKSTTKSAVDEANAKMFEKLQEVFGFNDEGGLII